MRLPLKPSRYVQQFDLEEGKVLLANLLWRTYLELELAEAAAWRSETALGGDWTELPQALRGLLLERKMLIESSFDEAGFISRRYDRNRFSFEVLGLTIAPTIDCNFACGYCYEDKRPGRMTMDVEGQIFEYVRRMLPSRKSLAVTWYGGEPLMCKETVYRLSEKFIAYAEEVGASYHAFMVTNSFLLKRDVVDRLSGLGHWRNIQVTIDGFGASHDTKRPTRTGKPTFSRIMENLSYAVEKLPMLVRMNVDLLNPDDCHHLLDVLVDMGLAPKIRVYFSPIHPFGKGCRDIAEKSTIRVATNEQFARIEVNLVQHAKELGFLTRDKFEGPWLQQCQAVSTHSLVIEPDGSLQRCWIEVGEDDKRIGHISQALDLTSENNLRWLRFDPTRNDPCRSCEVLPLCFGGCPHRHVYGAPEEFTCNQIRYNLKESILFEYLSKHRPEWLAQKRHERAAARRSLPIMNLAECGIGCATGCGR